MLHIHALLFFAVLELLLVFAVLWTLWFFKARRLTRQLAAAEATLAQPRAEPNAAAYFAAELQVTQARLDAQRNSDPPVDGTALALRAAYLHLERELAQGKPRDAEFWRRAEQDIMALLMQHAPAPAPVDAPVGPSGTPADAEESARVKRLFDAQIVTITELKEALASTMAEHPEWQTLLGQIEAITRTNREMSLCVSILEDDNAYLRGQLGEQAHPE